MRTLKQKVKKKKHKNPKLDQKEKQKIQKTKKQQMKKKTNQNLREDQKERQKQLKKAKQKVQISKLNQKQEKI